MAEYDGEVVIKARIETDGLENDASKISKNLNDSFNRSSQILSNLQKQYNNLVSGASKSTEQLGLEKSLYQLENRLDSLKSQYERTFQTLDRQYQGLFSNVREGKDVGSFNMGVYNDLMKRLTPFGDMINRTTERINELKQRLNEVKLNPEAQTSVLRLQNQISKLYINISKEQAKAQANSEKMAERARLQQERLQASEQRAMEKIRLAREQMAERARLQQERLQAIQARTQAEPQKNGMLKGVLGSLSGVMSSLSSGFSLLTSPIRGVIGLVQGLGRQILNIGKTAFILHGIRTGFRGISETISNVIASDNRFIVSLNQIKSNLVTAFYPIYQYILPALHSLMNALSVASSYLAQFVAHLFGQNYKAMQEGARSFVSVAQSADSSATAVDKNKNSFNELGKSIKKSSKELASFDKLNVLNLEKKQPKSPKQPKGGGGFAFTPTSNFDAGYENFLKGFDEFREKLMAKMQPTIDSFRELGETVKVKLGGFAAQAMKDFGTDFLEPASDYLLQIAIPKFNNITKNMIENTNWDNLNTSLDNLWKALEPFGETIGNGLLTFYEKAIAPLMSWATGDLISSALDVLSGALKVLNPILDEAQKFGWFLWDKFLRPIAEWTGGVIVATLKGMGDALNTIGDWLNQNRWFVEIAEAFLFGLAAGFAAINFVLWIQQGGLLKALTTLGANITSLIGKIGAFGAALLANPLTPWVIGIGAVIAAIILLIRHWDKVKETFGYVVDWIKDKWNKWLEWIKPAFNWVNDHILKPIGKVFGINYSERSLSGRIPGFAQGAVLRGGDPILAYLNDQPRGQTNIETPLNTMIDAFNTALENNRGITNNNIVVEASGDMDSIVSMLNFRIKQQDKITGSNFISDNIFA